MRYRYLVLSTTFFFVLSIVLGVLYYREHNQADIANKYPLLSSTLFQQQPNDTILNFQPLRTDIKAYLTGINVPHSFTFEYLFTGTTIRDGDSNQLVGASLMKIPIVMDMYKAIEENKIKIDTEVTVPDDIINSNDSEYGNLAHLKSGQKIKLGDAAKIALSESDNTAAYTIFNAVEDLLPNSDQALNNLDVETQAGNSSKGSLVYISSRSYTSILQCLYFSCFLNFNDSQAVLNDLSADSSDNNRIKAGVPKDVTVARKLGSFGSITQSDCGIVYAANRHYALCILLDENENSANQHIKTLSSMVYKYVNNLPK